MLSALGDVLPKVAVLAAFVGTVLVLGWLIGEAMDAPEAPVAGFDPVRGDAGTEPSPRPALRSVGSRRLPSSHPSLNSTHQIRDEFANPKGEITIVCYCGERLPPCRSRDEARQVFMVHQDVWRAFDEKRTIRSERLR